MENKKGYKVFRFESDVRWTQARECAIGAGTGACANISLYRAPTLPKELLHDVTTRLREHAAD